MPAHAVNALALDQRITYLSLDGAVEAASKSARKTAKLPPVGGDLYVPVSSNINVAVLDSGVSHHGDVNIVSNIHMIRPETQAQSKHRNDSNLALLYTFDENGGKTVFDRVAGSGALDLSMANRSRVSHDGGSVRVMQCHSSLQHQELQ